MNKCCLTRSFRVISLAVITVVILLIFKTYPASAQEITPSQSQTASSAGQVASKSAIPIITPGHTPGYKKQKEELLATFKAQIIAYQKAYKEFVLAKKQYKKLQTIESLNDAIEATKQAALRRNEVIGTYIEILHLELIQPQASLDPALRGQMIRANEALLDELKQFHQQIESIVSRDDLYQALFKYEDLFRKVNYIAYKSRFILKVDRLYQSTLELKAIRKELPNQKEAITQGDKLSELKFQRGLDEIDKQISIVDTSLKKIKTEIFPNEKTSADWYKESIKELTKAYAASLRATNYVIELLNPTKPTPTPNLLQR